MTVSQMRTAIAGAYEGPRWKLRVANMPEHQVIAVYYKFLNDGKFEKKKRPKKEEEFIPEQNSENGEFIPIQLKLNITY